MHAIPTTSTIRTIRTPSAQPDATNDVASAIYAAVRTSLSAALEKARQS